MQVAALSPADYRIVRRSRDDEIMRVKDRRDDQVCHGLDVVKRPVAQGNAGKCAVQMLPDVGGWCYRLIGSGC